MCVDCVLASPRITQVDPSDRALPEAVLSQEQSAMTYVDDRGPACLEEVFIFLAAEHSSNIQEIWRV
jgi:hypothetical protein